MRGKGKVNFSSIKNGQSNNTVTSSTSILPDKWYHVAGVYNVADAANGNQPALSLYVQGVRVSMNPSPQSARASLPGKKLLIGRENRNAGNTNAPSFFNGKIDEVRFSTEAVYTAGTYYFANGIEQSSWSHLTSLATTKGLWKFDNQDGRDASAKRPP